MMLCRIRVRTLSLALHCCFGTLEGHKGWTTRTSDGTTNKSTVESQQGLDRHYSMFDYCVGS